MLLWMSQVIEAQPLPISPEFVRIDSKTGLSSDNVTDILQDREGFLWFTTVDGINRFDGYDIKVFKPDFNTINSFNTVHFQCIEEDAEGNLWFGSYHSGINIYSRVDESVRIIDENGPEGMALLDNHINDIFCDSKNRMWISTFAGLNLYLSDSNKMITFSDDYSPKKTFPRGTVSRTFEDSRGRIIVGTFGEGLFLYNEEEDDFTQLLIDEIYNIEPYENRIWTMLEISMDTFWIGTWAGGLFKAVIKDGDPIEILTHYSTSSDAPNTLNSDIIYSLYSDPDSTLWIGTPYGLHLMENPGSPKSSITIIPAGSKPNEVSNNEINRIFSDRAGVIWLGTGAGGVNKADLSIKKFDLFTIPIEPQLESQAIRAFVKGPDSRFYVGVNGMGFGEYNVNDRTFISYTLIPMFRNVRKDLNAALCFLQDSRGYFWIGTRYFGLIRVRPETGEVKSFFPFESGSSRTIYSLLEDASNNIWVGTENGLFKLVSRDGPEPYQIHRFINDEDDPFSISGNFISEIKMDSRGNIWVGTVGNGLNRIGNSTNTNPQLTFQRYNADRSNPEGLKSDIVYSIHEDANKRIWIGTGAAGLALLNPYNGSFRHFSDNVGIRGDAIYDILEDDQNQLWLSSNNGITKFQFNNPDDTKVENFDYEDGLQGNIFNNGATYKDETGQMYFGGSHGFNRFRPDQFVRNEYISQPAFTQISVSNRPVNIYSALRDGLVIKHKDKSFEFSFTALSFSQEKKNKFSYILDDYDSDWQIVSSNRREVRYTNIPPGHYKFMLTASNSSDAWNDEPLILNIRILPAPAYTWWAFSIYGILLISILITIYYFLVNNIKIKQAYEIEKIEHIRDEKLAQFKLRFFTNISHELLTPLSVISCTVEDFLHNRQIKNDNILAMQRNINRLMRLISQLLDFRKVESGSMKLVVQKGDFNVFMKQMIDNFKPLTSSKNLDIELTGNLEKDIWFDLDKLDKIISNLMSNALKYSPDHGKLRIKYNLTRKENSNFLNVEFTDSGPGIDKEKLQHVFDRFYRIESVTGKTFGTGIGLALSKTLVEVHKGEIHVENDKELGAKFSFEIPVSKKSFDPVQTQSQEMDYNSLNQITDFEDYPDKDADDIPEISEDKKFTILIVEDNIDFRRLLSNYFSTFYNVIEADNGKQGLELTSEKHPDLVLSDVMMPEMNGVDLCKQIKTNLEISHILVILLTAKTGEQTMHEGYYAGADSYLAKPINLRILHTRVNSLLDQRIKLIEKFNTGYMPEPGEKKLPSLDNKFLTKIQDLIMDKITDPELNVTSLCREIGVSSSMLYRKLTRITGKSPVEFIRFIRLQNAARQMVKEDVNVSEAAYQNGFNDLSYFSKSFKNQFGSTPKQFIKDKSGIK